MKPPGARTEPAVATMIGRYLLLHRIAAGAAGFVYAADDPTLGRRVALKVIACVVTPGSNSQGVSWTVRSNRRV